MAENGVYPGAPSDSPDRGKCLGMSGMTAPRARW